MAGFDAGQMREIVMVRLYMCTKVAVLYPRLAPKCSEMTQWGGNQQSLKLIDNIWHKHIMQKVCLNTIPTQELASQQQEQKGTNESMDLPH